MRRLKLAALLAVVGAVAIATNAFALNPVTGADGNSQGLAVKLLPKKLSKTQYTPATLDVTTRLTTTNPVPVPAVRAILDFDKDTKIFAKGYPTCDPSLLQNTSTERALEECKKAKIGSGTAKALLPVGKQIFLVEPTVIAFNGPPQGGKPVILLHTYAQTPIQVTTVLSGPVSNFNKQGYGPRLDLTIPLLGGGAGALTDVHVTVKKSYKFKGKTRSYISAKCPDKKVKSRGEFVFKDGESLTPTVSASCTQKK
jgi:hypothetical protein